MTDIKPFRQLYVAATVMLIVGAAVFFVMLIQFGMWAADRTAPFQLLSYDAPPTRAGEEVVIKARAHRDLSRKCSAIYSRMFIDSRGNMFDLTEGTRMVNADTITEMNRRSPDGLTIKVQIPANAEPGPAVVMTALEYVCNPLHQIYPIQVTLLENMIVLEKR
jgi:hypothetical protein